MAKPRAKMVMTYAHKDRDFLKRSALLGFLQGLARAEKWEFWWDEKMDHPLFDEEIKRQLDEADIIVCLVSQYFLISDYVTKVESQISNKRLRTEGVLVVPIMLDASLIEYEEWLNDIHRFPKNGYLRSSHNKGEIFLEITKYITKWFHGRALPFRNPEMIYRLRRLRETSLTEEQVRILNKDSCDRARKIVPDADLRRKIVQAARIAKKKTKGKPLSKEELEKLDKQFLVRGRRKPDAEIVRWILRCEGLHPQGRVP